VTSKKSAHRAGPSQKGADAVEGPLSSGPGEGAKGPAAAKEPAPPAVASLPKGKNARKHRGARKAPFVPEKGPRPNASARRRLERTVLLE
jgi:hypothetical protein